jgi:RNA polymerase sigma-70 factor (ECF subfamily)
MESSAGNLGVHAPKAAFVTTHWSVVLAATQAGSPEAESALGKLCATYWFPLYAFVRRRGYSPEEAEDLTQGFFTQLLERQRLSRVEREGGRFRSFLLTCLKNFLSSEWNRAQAQKRGGGASFISLDRDKAEDEYRLQLGAPDTPETLFERQWALTLLDRVLDQLRTEWTYSHRAGAFELLQPWIVGECSEGGYAELGARLQCSVGAARVAVHRLRQRYRQVLQESISETVSSPEEISDELSYLMSVVAR